jgi:hypothetical protein
MYNVPWFTEWFYKSVQYKKDGYSATYYKFPLFFVPKTSPTETSRKRTLRAKPKQPRPDSEL